MKYNKVLITGGSGYLGGFAIDQLTDSYDLTVFDRVQPDKDVQFIKGDITKFEDVDSACQGQDAVVHLAALVRGRSEKTHEDFADIMVKGSWNIAAACVNKKVERLVNISSIIAIGPPQPRETPFRETDPADFKAGDLYYCLSKSLGEQIGNAYHQAHGLNVIHIRPGVIEGDGSNPGPKEPEDPNQPWFIYVSPKDVAYAIQGALETEVTNGAYNILAGRQDSLYDISAARRDLGFAPQFNWPEISEGKSHEQCP
jgi:nucleoside-diphosphate-sugar epimerase